MSGTTKTNTYAPFLASDIISQALAILGVGAMGTVPSDADMTTGLQVLNMMMSQWQIQGAMIPYIVDAPIISNGSSKYYIGPCNNADSCCFERPGELLGVYVRLLGGGAVATGVESSEPGEGFDATIPNKTDVLASTMPIDYRLNEITSYENYISISMKGLKALPTSYFYNPAYPNGELFVWPIPPAGMYEIHVIYRQFMTGGFLVDSTVRFPNEYMEPMVHSLACRLAPIYGADAPPVSVQLAQYGMDAILRANMRIPTLNLPDMGTSRNGNGWRYILGGW